MPLGPVAASGIGREPAPRRSRLAFGLRSHTRAGERGPPACPRRQTPRAWVPGGDAPAARRSRAAPAAGGSEQSAGVCARPNAAGTPTVSAYAAAAIVAPYLRRAVRNTDGRFARDAVSLAGIRRPQARSANETMDDYLKSLVNESEANIQVPFCRTYTSVTSKGFVTSLPPTMATRRIVFSTMAVVPTNRTDAAWISALLY